MKAFQFKISLLTASPEILSKLKLMKITSFDASLQYHEKFQDFMSEEAAT